MSSDPQPAPIQRYQRLALLFLLYFAQGLPFGLQTELPLLFRQAGMSLANLGFARLVSWPWSVKALWAPLVDRFGSKEFGRRKSWIVPMQILLAATCVAAGFFPPSGKLQVLLGLVVVMNLLSATQDIAVDGLAVDMLKGQDLGPANTAQVVGFKAGMIVGGGVMMQFYDVIGWRGMLWAIAGLLIVIMAIVVPTREPPPVEQVDKTRESFGSVLDALGKTLAEPQALWLLLFVSTYKLGESLVDPMFKPFLIDAGYKPALIAKWVTSYGLIASLCGSVVGGFLAFRLPLLSAVALTATLRAFSVAGEWYLTLHGKPAATPIIVVTMVEHFCGGALTTAMFAFMMSRVNKAVGASHYTLLACVEVLGKMPAGLLSGVLAERMSYRGLFGLGTLLSFAFLLLLFPLRRGPRPAGAPKPAPG